MELLELLDHGGGADLSGRAWVHEADFLPGLRLLRPGPVSQALS